MKKIIIFDLDGTLLSTLDDLTTAVNYALNQFNYPQKSINSVKNYVGNGVEKLIERAIPNGLNNPDYKNCLEIFKNYYSNNMYNQTKPYENIIPMLKKLKSNGLKIAVVSNKFDAAVKNLCDKYFPNLIDFASGEDEKNGIKKKPSPDTVLKILKNFNFKPEDAFYVGDSEVDIQTAKNSNVDSISVTWGFKDRQFLIDNGGKILVDTPDEIISIVLSS